MAGKKIGVIDHYYDRIGVAVIKLEQGSLTVGDKIKIKDRQGKDLFEQEVDSMQIEGKDVKKVKKGRLGSLLIYGNQILSLFYNVSSKSEGSNIIGGVLSSTLAPSPPTMHNSSPTGSPFSSRLCTQTVPS